MGLLLVLCILKKREYVGLYVQKSSLLSYGPKEGGLFLTELTLARVDSSLNCLQVEPWSGNSRTVNFTMPMQLPGVIKKLIGIYLHQSLKFLRTPMTDFSSYDDSLAVPWVA